MQTVLYSSAAAAYLGLRVGQVFEAAIPIAIIAVGLSGALNKKNAIGQNVIIQSIGACSGVIVAGAIFTLPALYILQAKYPRVLACEPLLDFEPSPLTSTCVVAVASGKGYLPCMSFTKYLRKGMKKSMPSMPPNSELRNISMKLTVMSGYLA